MLRRTLLILTTSAISLPACGDDKGDTVTAGATTTSSTSSGDASTGGSTSTGDASTGAPTTSTTADTTTTTTTTDATTGDATTGGSTGAGSTGGQDFDCDAIPEGPFDTETILMDFSGSEDLAFDGAGNLALKQEGAVMLVTSDGQGTMLADGFPQIYGTRFLTTGDLLVALPQQGVLQTIAPDGTVSDVAADLESPNGIYVDPTGAVWVTEFGGSAVVRFDAAWNKTTIFQGPEAGSANGVVLDPARGLLFFTNYGAGRLLRIAVDAQGQPSGQPAEVGTIPGAKLDGLALDACGNVYAVDQGNSQLYRFRLDAMGVATGEPENLTNFPKNTANVQFGAGAGFDPESLYGAGNPGEVYRVAVGVPGAPIGLP
jgi:hypothetical protein